MVNLTYRDTEGLLVEVFTGEEGGGCSMDVFRMLTSQPELLAQIQFRDLKNAQKFARLLVGIEIQEDGAAWKRGPRPPAKPTDEAGNIIEEPEG